MAGLSFDSNFIRAVSLDTQSGEKTATVTIPTDAATIEFTVLSGTWTCNGITYTADGIEHHKMEIAGATLPAVTITASGSSPRLALDVQHKAIPFDATGTQFDILEVR